MSPTRKIDGHLLMILAAFVAGFAITAIEIALGRLLAPYFGAGLAVWSCIISAVIVAISVGYMIGGRLGDRWPKKHGPFLILSTGSMLATLLGLTVPLYLRHTFIDLPPTGAWYWLHLGSALVLFGIPCLVLASLTPFTLRLTTRDPSTIGSDAGFLYGVGSFGSVLGILFAGLWWIPIFGLRTTFILIGFSGVSVGFFGLYRVRWHFSPALLSTSLVLPMALYVPAVFPPADIRGASILHDGDSGLQHVRVLADDRGIDRIRYLQLDEGRFVHSILHEPLYASGTILDHMGLLSLLAPSSDGTTDILIIGLAGGTISNVITKLLPEALGEFEITGVELDPAVVQVADEFMGLDRSRLQVHVADGRVWLRSSDRRFDLILLDAYRQPSIPAHLATSEFFREVAEHLEMNGVAAMHVSAVARSPMVRGIVATWASVFLTTHLLESDPVGFTSHLVVGKLGSPIEIEADLEERLPIQLHHAYLDLRANLHPLGTADGVEPWTDDKVPVELLASLGSLR